jgi:hypothetical protein
MPFICDFIFFGGRLIALQKKSGAIRPIAIGYTWRLLAAKCVNKYVTAALAGSLVYVKLGVGISGGCEATVHYTRRFLASMPDDHVIVKLDLPTPSNASEETPCSRSLPISCLT